MATRPYVLITTEPGKVTDVAQGPRKIVGVSAADVVTGNYDVVAVVEQPNAEGIGRLVLNQVHGLPVMKTTTTLIAVA